jgi:hypothetical protein
MARAIQTSLKAANTREKAYNSMLPSHEEATGACASRS